MGDDYGAMGLPHGRYAGELELYVREAGIPPLDVLRWATRLDRLLAIMKGAYS